MNHDPSTQASDRWCQIAPPDILIRIVDESDDDSTRRAAARTLATSAALRARRSVVAQLMSASPATLMALLPEATGARNTVFDAEHGGRFQLPGVRRRADGDGPHEDQAVNEAWEGADATARFYGEILERNSIDGAGMELVSSVHYGVDFDNAFWDGTQMVYGDGSGTIFRRGGLTAAIDVIAHELTHGVTQFTAGLDYSGQPGALNESFSDVFGSLVKQRAEGEAAADADWLIGEGILGTAFKVNHQALRSLKEPGTANDFDRQPARMGDYVDLPEDNVPAHDHGGVHINSGIPNHAFYRTAIELGGNAWDRAGKIWYEALTGGQLQHGSDFRAAADATISAAASLFGAGSTEHATVEAAWKDVGVL